MSICPRGFYRLFGKVFLFFIIFVSFNSLSVSASVKDDVSTTVSNFIQAQKNCNIDAMINNSRYFLEIENLTEFYTRHCSENPLQQASITDLRIVNNDLALVSILSTYRDRINIRTSPVIKDGGKWKVIIGIPPSEVKSIKNSKMGSREEEIAKLFNNYVSAIKANDINKMKMYIKVVTKSGNENIDEHLKELSRQPIPEVTTYGIKMISDSVAIVETENKFSTHSYSQNLAVYNDNGQWKIIFGYPLTNTYIPKSGKSIEIK